ncbi:MAG: hypothetical protein ACW99L_19380 [Promethearchaeota archaeon]
MAYSEKARALRRCTAIKPNGEPCKAWAVWDDSRQLCVVHAGRHHKGRMGRSHKPKKKARYIPCTCEAYSWPHRPGGGLCNWPDSPKCNYEHIERTDNVEIYIIEN